MQFQKFIIPLKSYIKNKPKIKDVGPGKTKILRQRFIKGNVLVIGRTSFSFLSLNHPNQERLKALISESRKPTHGLFTLYGIDCHCGTSSSHLQLFLLFVYMHQNEISFRTTQSGMIAFRFSIRMKFQPRSGTKFHSGISRKLKTSFSD